MNYKKVFLSLGSNLGNKIENLIKAIIEISKLENSRIIKISSLYETHPVGYIDQPNFYNIGVYLQTKLTPHKLLKLLNKIEHKLHRVREMTWGERTIDIDIILYDKLNIKTDKLIIPHKEYKKRNFVLDPLYEIFPDTKRRKKNINYGVVRKIKPYVNIGISACLVGINTKYNGKNNCVTFFKELFKIVNLIPVCPEQLGGLSTPREPVEILNTRVVDCTGNDVTDNFNAGALETYKILKLLNCEYVIFKSNSPSCGYRGIYSGEFNSKLIDENGITADYVLKRGIKIIKN